MPTNLYGPNDNFDLEKSHVLPALIRKIHLGNCLEEGNWIAIREDLNKRPIVGITGDGAESDILGILSKYGIKMTRSEKREARSEINPPSAIRHLPSAIEDSASSIKDLVQVEIWGSGSPLREFLWSEEMADACVYLMENINFREIVSEQPLANNQQPETRNTHINIGTGKEITIKDLANLVKNTVGFRGELFFNTSKPDGTMRKLTDPSKLHQLGWHHKIEIEEGVRRLYDWYVQPDDRYRMRDTRYELGGT
jgi:GDP-L-fucose synthase